MAISRRDMTRIAIALLVKIGRAGAVRPESGFSYLTWKNSEAEYLLTSCGKVVGGRCGTRG